MKSSSGLAGICTTDALVEMFHKECDATDVTGHFVRALRLFEMLWTLKEKKSNKRWVSHAHVLNI